MTALEVFRLIANEFIAVPDAVVSRYFELGATEMSESIFGSSYNKALAYYAAHMLKMNDLVAGGTNSLFAVKSEKEGDLQRTYAVSDVKYADGLNATLYGQELKKIQRLCVVPIITR